MWLCTPWHGHAFGIASRTGLYLLPGVLVGGVVGNKIEDDAKPMLMRKSEQRIEVMERPEERINVTVERKS